MTMTQLVLWFLLLTVVVVTSSSSPARPAGCLSSCGPVDIPYPFGVDDNDCSWHGSLTVICNKSFSPPRPFAGNIKVKDISVETGEMRVYGQVSYICYNSSSSISTHETYWWFNLTGSSALFSPTRNVFTAIGCNTLALLKGGKDWSYYTGCITSCASLEDAARDGDACTGLGCCQTQIPGNLTQIWVDWNNGSATPHNPAWTYSPCSYAFVADKEWYHFTRQDLSGNGSESFINRVGDRTIPIVLDWAIPDSDGPPCLPNPEAGGKPHYNKTPPLATHT